tara:strand:+ start:518 stop:631 length:114 start_codon:yes stop_codon:yes gene_type:complete
MNNSENRIEPTFEKANDRAEATTPAHHRSTPNPGNRE